MRSTPTPLHLLFFGHPLAHHLVHCRFRIWQRFGSEFSTSLISDDPSQCRFRPLWVSIRVQREIDFEVRQFQGLEDVFAVLVSFDRDALDVDPGRGGCSFSDQIPQFFISFDEVDRLGV
jgi:hypothetical protein